MTDQYDVIMVGSGAGGGTLARTMAPSGKRILLLERGNYLPRELRNWDPRQVRAGRYVSPDTWYDAAGSPFEPQVHYFVGGATKLYGAALCRLRPADFGEIGHLDGLSPAWPLTYGEFEPWYAKAEWLYQVRGLHGEDPSEGPWSEEYPWPPISHEPLIQQIADHLGRAGYHPFHVPRGIMLDETNRPASECIRCNRCDGYPCLIHAKADADVVAVRPLLGMPNVTLLVDAEVTSLETDPGGRSVTKVIVTHAGAREEYRGDLVVLAAGAVNSARVLLRSASDRHPAGLANGSGQVGRNYMCHTISDVVALGEKANETVFQQTLGINAFYLAGDRARTDHQADESGSWPLGSIQMLSRTEQPALRRGATRRMFPDPRDTENRAVGLRLITEDLPRPDNRVTVDHDGHLRLSYDATNNREAAMLYHELGMMLSQADLQVHRWESITGLAGAGTDHQAGTCRFGRDPATSVLDINCKAHELDNLYVVDASFFPSVGAVGPALTTMANAIRVGEHLIRRLRLGAKGLHPRGVRRAGRQARMLVHNTLPGQRAGRGGDVTVDYPLLDVFWTMLWFFAMCVWVFLVAWTIILIFRRRDLSGWAKAAWLLFVIFVPLLGVVAYLVARGGHMAEEQVSEYNAPQDEAYRAYARYEAQGRHSADELSKLADLRDRGIITDEEFQRGKVQLLN